MYVLVKQVRERLSDQDFCEWCYIPITVMLVACLIVFVTCTCQMAWVFTAERNLTLGEPYRVCEQPLGNRCDTEHDAISPDQTRRVFEPYMFEFEPGVLHYDLNVYKPKYSFTYQLDGQKESWPYLPALCTAWMSSLLGLAAWLLLGGPMHFGRLMRHGKD